VNQEGFLIKTVSGLSSALESVILNEKLAQAHGLIQSLDPRVKLFTFVLLILAAGLARSLWILAAIFILVLVLVIIGRIPLLFLPFTAIVALPALFIVPGDSLLQIGGRVIVTVQGAHTAGFLLLRVMDSISFGILLILTTPWNSLLLALRWFRLPAIIIDILGMTYRYIFLLLHTTNSMFLARRSRSLGSFSGAENRRWLSRTLASTMAKSQHLSEEVYLAMTARGYQGEIFAFNRLQFRNRDYWWLGFALVVAAFLLWSIYR
jgi:cobalt/nickel transport system permease protein